MADGTHDHGTHDHGGCEEALAELYTYLDGELTDVSRARIQHHLDDCSPCLEVYDFEAELRLVVRHRCQEQVPDSLRARIAEQLARYDAADQTEPTAGADAP